MDTNEIKNRKLKLRDDITNRIRRFQQETGCVPEIDIGYIRVETMMGHSPECFPEVRIRVYLD